MCVLTGREATTVRVGEDKMVFEGVAPAGRMVKGMVMMPDDLLQQANMTI